MRPAEKEPCNGGSKQPDDGHEHPGDDRKRADLVELAIRTLGLHDELAPSTFRDHDEHDDNSGTERIETEFGRFQHTGGDEEYEKLDDLRYDFRNERRRSVADDRGHAGGYPVT